MKEVRYLFLEENYSTYVLVDLGADRFLFNNQLCECHVRFSLEIPAPALYLTRQAGVQARMKTEASDALL